MEKLKKLLYYANNNNIPLIISILLGVYIDGIDTRKIFKIDKNLLNFKIKFSNVLKENFQ